MDLITVTDSNQILEMKNYNECTNDSPEELKLQRGLIYEKSSNEILVQSFGYNDSYTLDEIDVFKNVLNPIEDWNFYFSVEATLLRIFHYENNWYIVTHKKLDAFKSRWSCRETFGELFVNALSKLFDKKVENVLEWFYTLLDPNKVYCFLLKSNFENRIVCQYYKKEDKIVYLGIFNIGNEYVFDSNIPNIKEFEQFGLPIKAEINSLEDMIVIISKINCFEYQGLIAMHKTKNKQIKIYNSDYKRYFDLRGNNPNLRFRYLELRNNPEKINMLYHLYPKSADIFDQYEDILNKISRMIYHFYVNRYIKNQFITLPKEEFLIMKKCHDWYLQDRKNNRIFAKKVLEFMSEDSALNLYKMIRRFHLNQNMVLHETKKNFDNNILQSISS
jgi:hypothetical protein